jgi:signal transduction histidine kinase
LKVRALIVDDSEDDVLLVVKELQRAGFDVDWHRVETAAGLRESLGATPWDLVLTDWTMPSFDGPSAVAAVVGSGFDIPVIIVSGTVSEDVIVEAVRRGASDYVAKHDLRRLVPAVERELSRRQQRLSAGIALEESRARVAVLEDHLERAQRMESIGRVAGAIAHDFNNLLTAITASADFVLERLPRDDQLHGDVFQIRTAAERGADLVRQLLAFSRRQTLVPEIVDVNAKLRDLELFIGRTLGVQHQLMLALDPEIAFVRVDPTKLEQVILNLAVNARDAMPCGGIVTIETAEVELEPSHAGVAFDLPSGRYVRLCFRDTGVGMTEDVRARAFEPFFTTKEPGKGTGLGLASVYGIVTQSGGAVSIVSEPGRGTRFDIYLPLAHDVPFSQQIRVARNVGSAHGEETILVVDDEELVRRAAVRVLRSAGYTVLEASSGPSALAMFEAHRGPVHLLVTDLVMPDMTGTELAQRIMAAHGEAKVLITSGSTENMDEPPDTERMLKKPYSAPGLLKKVRETLDQRAPRKARKA